MKAYTALRRVAGLQPASRSRHLCLTAARPSSSIAASSCGGVSRRAPFTRPLAPVIRSTFPLLPTQTRRSASTTTASAPGPSAAAASLDPSPSVGPSASSYDRNTDEYGLPKQGPKLLVPFLVTIFGCSLIYNFAGYYSEIQTERLIEAYNLPRIRRQTQHTAYTASSSTFGDFSSFFTVEGGGSDAPPSSRARSRQQAQLDSAHAHDVAHELGIFVRSTLDAVSFLPREAQMQFGRACTYLAQSYLELTPSQRAVIPIIGINTLVFLGFRLPSARARLFMWTHFTHQPNSQRYYTMATSTFAHAGFIHFALNNYVLWQFSQHFIRDPVFREGRAKFDFGLSLDPKIGHMQRNDAKASLDGSHDLQWSWDDFTSIIFAGVLGNESINAPWTPDASPTAHFLAFWISAGLVASFGSQIWAFSRFRAARFALRRRIKAMPKTGPSASMQFNADLASRVQSLRGIGFTPGLGASGALLATLGAVAACHPEAMIGIIFLPQTAVPAQTAVSGLMLFDATCLLLTLLNSPIGAAARSLSLGHAAHLMGTVFGIAYASPARPRTGMSTANDPSPSRAGGQMSEGMGIWEHVRQHYISEKEVPRSSC
ncbi:unnamed protein product [Tilletia controversa]|nr:unnamed protein product [Tilletia controversa]